MRIFPMFALAALVGCRAPEMLNTPTGFPEVTIRATPKAIRDQLAGDMLPFGWSVRSSTEYQWTVGTPDKGAAAGFLAGTAAAPTPEHRRTYSFTASGGETRVSVRAWTVSNPGTGFEKLYEFHSGTPVNADIQRSLERLKAILER